MDLIRDVADWIASGWGERLGFLFPMAVIGLVGLYVLWLIVGYLRVSQVGVAERRSGLQAAALPRSADGALEAPRGAPYCATDGLQYPLGAQFCSACERDLSLDCTTCGATVRAADASCYRCGSSTGARATALLG